MCRPKAWRSTELADAAQLASLADETPEGRSIVVLAKKQVSDCAGATFMNSARTFIPFTAQTRMSGVDLRRAADSQRAPPTPSKPMSKHQAAIFPPKSPRIVERIAKQGGTPLVVAEGGKALGVIHLKDIVKGGMRERFAEMRQMGIQTVMITGDNPLTAAAIAAEAGVDDFLAEATPETNSN